MAQLYKQVYALLSAYIDLIHKELSSLSFPHPPPLPVGAAAATATVAAATAPIEECFLCDAPVDVKFEPCGHAILCSECAERAKKCLKCKV